MGRQLATEIEAMLPERKRESASGIDGLITFARVLASVLIWILIFLPVWGIILFLVIFFRRRRKSKAKTP